MEVNPEVFGTNILIADLGNKSLKGIITMPVLIELVEFHKKQYNYKGKKQDERAEGHLRILINLPKLLGGYALYSFNLDDVRDIVYYVMEKGLSPTDAYLTWIPRKEGWTVVPRDKDFERVRDRVKVRIL